MQTHKKKTGQAEHVCPNCRRRYLRRLYRQASRFSDSVDQEWRNPNSQHRAVATSIEAKLLPPTIRIMVHRRRQACQTMAETNEKNSGLLRLMMKVTSRTFCPAEAAQGSSRGETKTQPKCLPREMYSCCVCICMCFCCCSLLLVFCRVCRRCSQRSAIRCTACFTGWLLTQSLSSRDKNNPRWLFGSAGGRVCR